MKVVHSLRLPPVFVALCVPGCTLRVEGFLRPMMLGQAPGRKNPDTHAAVLLLLLLLLV
jgi:hypothetical protein